MSTTFACPHCGQSYPIKPVLIGKVVRCTGCKNPFRLREDGIAEIVSPPRQTPAPEPVATPAVAANESSRGSSSIRRIADDAKAKEIKERMAEARKAMAADLSQAAGKALQSSTVKAEEGTERRQGSSRMAAVKNETGKRRIGPAILTGEGEREAANSRNWIIGGVLGLGVAVGLGWLLSLDGPRTAAIEGFTQVLPPDQNVYGSRDLAIANRGWLTAESGAVTPFIDLGTVRWGRTMTLTPASYGAALTRLASFVPVHPSGLWVAAKDLDKATAALAGPGTDAPDKRLLAARIPFLAWSAIAKDLTTAGVGEALIDDLRLILLHKAAPGATPQTPGLLAGTATLEFQLLSGAQGTYLQDLGGNYRMVSSPWEGVLLRPVDGTWRMLRLTPVRR